MHSRFGIACSLVLMALAHAAWAAAPQAPPGRSPAAPGQGPAKAPPPAKAPAQEKKDDPAETLRRDLDRIFAEAGLPKTVIAARVLALGDGLAAEGRDAAPEVLYSVRAGEPLVPASTMKLLVTAACWDRLGPAWSIRTEIGRLPPARKGDPPDLAVIGGGDPNFSGRFHGGDVVGAFRLWAAELKARGITRAGRLLLDDGLLEPAGPHPNWPADQRHEWYEAVPGALNLNDNCIDITVAPGEAGKAALVTLDPATAYAAVENRVRTVADKDDHRFSLQCDVLGGGALPALRVRAAGGCWVKAGPATECRTVPDPTAFFGVALAETLRAEGIEVAGPVVRAALVAEEGRDGRFLCDVIHVSRLDRAVAVANTRSQGLYAEILMKLLGAFGPNPAARYGAAEPASRPRIGSWESGRAELVRWLAERGLPAEGCVFDDGSGLSKENRLTAMCVTDVLAYMHRRHGEAFVETLAQPGRDGSLAKRMRGTAAEGRLWAKTGYVYGVSCLSGYVRTRTGRLLAFSVLMNGVPWGELWRARLAQDKACLRMVDCELTSDEVTK